MLVALIARDKPDAIETRKSNRDAHLAYIEEPASSRRRGR